MALENWFYLLLGIAVTAAAQFLRSYVSEKGKNQAISEDLDKVTRALESIRVESQTTLERQKAGIEHAQLINRTQFELELAAYREVWAAVIPVHRAASSLRPMMDWGLGEGETEDSRKRARLGAFGESFNPFSEAVWKHRPFYPPEVFRELDELLRLMRSEAIEYQLMDPVRHESYWEKAIENAKAINAQVDRVSDTIRARISNARVA
jgi:hypothetical protein